MFWSPPFHSKLLLDNSASFTSWRMKGLCQKWKVKLIFRGAWNRLMARPDWPWSPPHLILRHIYATAAHVHVLLLYVLRQWNCCIGRTRNGLIELICATLLQRGGYNYDSPRPTVRPRFAHSTTYVMTEVLGLHFVDCCTDALFIYVNRSDY